MNAIEFIQPDADIRQGDVFMLRETLFAPFNAKHGIAITADCDFANQKHYGRVLFCPLVPLDSYAEEFWSRARLNGIRAKTIDDAREKIARLLDEPAQGPINISARGAEELISNNGAVELFLQTECETKPDKKKAELRQLTKIFATIVRWERSFLLCHD